MLRQGMSKGRADREKPPIVHSHPLTTVPTAAVQRVTRCTATPNQRVQLVTTCTSALNRRIAIVTLCTHMFGSQIGGKDG